MRIYWLTDWLDRTSDIFEGEHGMLIAGVVFGIAGLATLGVTWTYAACTTQPSILGSFVSVCNLFH